MPETLKSPNFKTEQKEAEWWDFAEGIAQLRRALKISQRMACWPRNLKRERCLTPTTTIHLDRHDFELAKAHAEKGG